MDVVPPELLAPPPRDRRRLDPDGRAALVDGLLRRLARQEALCRRILGRLARAFLERRGHHRLAFARLDDWARERLGLSGREVQELGRVARRLAELPALDAAFAEGTVSWSHVRLLASVATPDTEAAWLARARVATVRSLDAAVAAARGRPPDPDDDAVDGELAARVRIRCPRRVRRLWRYATELASRMSGARLPAWRAAEAVAAEGAASNVAPEVAPDRPPGSPRRPQLPDVPLWEAIAECIPDDVENLARNVDSIDSFQLDAGLRAGVRALQRVDFQTGRLLRLVAELRLHLAFGCPTFPDYVRERLGFSLRRARALVSLDRRLVAFPTLADTYRDGRLSLGRALLLLPVLAPDTEAAWVARAQEVTIRRLGDLVDWAIEVGEPDHPLAPPPAEGTLVVPDLDPVQMCARACDAEVAFTGPATVVALFQATVQAYTPRGRPRWHGLERLLRHVIAEWSARPRHRDPIFERDGWRCAVPTCTARSSLHDHHVVYRSRGGDNHADNRVAICAHHHLNGIHRMRIRVDGVAPHDLTWQFGLRPARPPLIRTHGDRYLDVA